MDIAISFWVWHAQPLANPVLPSILAACSGRWRIYTWIDVELLSGCWTFFLVTVLYAFYADWRSCNFVTCLKLKAVAEFEKGVGSTRMSSKSHEKCGAPIRLTGNLPNTSQENHWPKSVGRHRGLASFVLHGGGGWSGHETQRSIVMKKALMFLALNVALSAVPVGVVTFALIAGTTAITTVHPQEVLAKLRHFQPLSAQRAKGTKAPA
jgi:hypothetical protein